MDNGSTYHYCYDGNGNVAQLIDSSDGTIDAHYEYDPFGKLNYSSGSYADENTFRFSTKYLDAEYELYYYGYRYYSPDLGRWISRDPLEEEGGLNLYLFVNNNSLNFYDMLGLWNAGTHRILTADAFNWANRPEDMSKYFQEIIDVLKEANVSVDEKLLSDNRWHFNRDVDTNNSKVESAIESYKKLLNDEWDKKITIVENPDLNKCRQALVTVGMLSHAWQDYYAHAININSDGSKETIGRVEGNPADPGSNMKPASWGYIGKAVWKWDFGEHGASEPGKRAPEDTSDRMAKAKEYTQQEFNKFIEIWWKPCKCYAKEMFK